MCFGGGDGGFGFDGIGLAAESELESAGNLLARIVAGFFDHAVGKSCSLIIHKGAVEKVERLNCRGGLFAAGQGLAGIRRIENTKDGNRFHADFVW